jgi:hypothetical protein
MRDHEKPSREAAKPVAMDLKIPESVLLEADKIIE